MGKLGIALLIFAGNGGNLSIGGRGVAEIMNGEEIEDNLWLR